MSAVDELLKNLMQRAGIEKSRKRGREDCEDKTYLPCRNTKTRPESSNTDSLSSEAKSIPPVANNC